MSYMKRTIDVENQDDAWMSDIEPDMAFGELPDTSHWPAIKHLTEKLYRLTNADAWTVASLIDDPRYLGAANARLKAAESALREAARELHMASGELG